MFIKLITVNLVLTVSMYNGIIDTTPGEQHENSTGFWRSDGSVEHRNGHRGLPLHCCRLLRLPQVWG